MGMMNSPNCIQVLFPETRRAILGVLLVQTERWWYLTELATALGKAPSSLQSELHAFRRAGLLEHRVDGRKVYFRINANSGVVRGLQQVFACGIPRAA